MKITNRIISTLLAVLMLLGAFSTFAFAEEATEGPEYEYDTQKQTLDYQTGKAILKLLQDTGRKTGMTVIIITHNSALTAMADRVIRVRSGTVCEVTTNANPLDIREIEW